MTDDGHEGEQHEHASGKTDTWPVLNLKKVGGREDDVAFVFLDVYLRIVAVLIYDERKVRGSRRLSVNPCQSPSLALHFSATQQAMRRDAQSTDASSSSSKALLTAKYKIQSMSGTSASEHTNTGWKETPPHTSDHRRDRANIKNSKAQKMTARLFFIGTWL